MRKKAGLIFCSSNVAAKASPSLIRTPLTSGQRGMKAERVRVALSFSQNKRYLMCGILTGCPFLRPMHGLEGRKKKVRRRWFLRPTFSCPYLWRILMGGRSRGRGRRGCSWLLDGYSQILRLYVFGPSGIWTIAPLRYAAKFCHLATLGTNRTLIVMLDWLCGKIS